MVYHTPMRPKKAVSRPVANQAMCELRKVIGKTQAQLATTLGVSVETVKSWELGRNKLKPAQAHRILMATGVHTEALLAGHGPLMNTYGRPYSRESFERWRKRAPRPMDQQAEQLYRTIRDSVWLLYHAAAMPGRTDRDRLPALHVSMLEWLKQNYADFNLAPEVEKLLLKRKRKKKFCMSYGDWRAETSGGFREFYNFVDDPTRPDSELLTLETEVWPCWNPGSQMDGKDHQILQLLPVPPSGVAK